MNDDLISKNALLKQLCEGCNGAKEIGCGAPCCDYDLITNAPVVDAVEVVRCKDCKHWIIDSYWNGNPEQIRACRFAGWMVGANGYCVYGEKNDLECIKED